MKTDGQLIRKIGISDYLLRSVRSKLTRSRILHDLVASHRVCDLISELAAISECDLHRMKCCSSVVAIKCYSGTIYITFVTDDIQALDEVRLNFGCPTQVSDQYGLNLITLD